MTESGAVAENWTRVGEFIAARMRAIPMTKAELQRRSGVSQKTLDGYLAGQPIVLASKKRGLCDALRWSRDSVDLIAGGGEPVPLPDLDPELDRRLSALETQMAELVELVFQMTGKRPGEPG
jgi:transcriptional regulator with XRE-family HTH domain